MPQEPFQHICDLYNIELIFLFGSNVKDKTTAKSDLDIGVYLTNLLSPEKTWKLQCSLIDIYKRSDVDMVILNDASPLLLFDLLLNHKVIYMRNEDVLYGFFSWFCRRYWQYKSHFKKYANQLKRVRLEAMGMIK
ncbi:MAG: nucleotidyltransferase domain-containing protein [Nitrospinae bacterium]|nr:nucleotidyltransferase domain-containing protein [Nitrospinota bacterium]